MVGRKYFEHLSRSQIILVIGTMDIMGEQCIRNDYGKVMVDGFGIRNAWKEHYNHLLNEEFNYDTNSQNPAAPVQGPSLQMGSCKVKEAVNKMKNGKASSASGITVEILKASHEVGTGIVADRNSN